MSQITKGQYLRLMEWIKANPKGSYVQACNAMGWAPELVLGHSNFYAYKNGTVPKKFSKEDNDVGIEDLQIEDVKIVKEAKKEMNRAVDAEHKLHEKIAEQEKLIYELRTQLAEYKAAQCEPTTVWTDEAKAELEKMQAICKQIEAERDYAVNESKELAEKLKNAEAGKEFAEAELDEFKAKADAHNKFMNETGYDLTKQIEDLNAALDAANNELHDALDKIQDQRVTIDGLERCKVLIQDERNELEAKYEELHNEYNDVMIDIARHAMKEW